VAHLKQTFGARLKTLRTASGLTQESFGKLVGVDYKHIGAIERGIRAPSFDVVERIAKVLKVQPYQLFLTPDEKIDIEGEVRAVASGMTKAQRVVIKGFLETVLRAAKKIDS
jgi:transcriptional regulator with XRE-family HTH domain